MKLNVLFALLATAIALTATQLTAKETVVSPVTIAVDNVPLTPLIQALAESQRLDIALAPGINSRITLTLTSVNWRQALAAISENGGMVWRLHDRIVQVHPSAVDKKLPESSAGTQSARVALVGKTFRLKHIEAKALLALLTDSGQSILSGQGSIVADPRTNRLLVRETKPAIARLREWVDQLDIPLGQVELAAHIVTMNRQSLDALGVQWRRAGRIDALPATGIDINLSAPEATSWLGFNIARIGGRALGLALSAMEQKHQLEIIASPRLLATHQQPASIKQGSEIPYQVGHGENGRNSVEFKDAVLGMEVTPEILDGQRLRLKLRITQNMPGQKLKQAEGEVLTIDKQEIETQVIVNNDETLALGGIFQQKRRESADGVPVLSNVPLVGGLFRSRGHEQEKRELVVFITPRIIAAR